MGCLTIQSGNSVAELRTAKCRLPRKARPARAAALGCGKRLWLGIRQLFRM